MLTGSFVPWQSEQPWLEQATEAAAFLQRFYSRARWEKGSGSHKGKAECHSEVRETTEGKQRWEL